MSLYGQTFKNKKQSSSLYGQTFNPDFVPKPVYTPSILTKTLPITTSNKTLSPGPTIEALSALKQSSQGASSNPTIGEDYFLANPFPIRQNDNPIIKGLKGIGNIGLSALSAPGELLRRAIIQSGNLLSGNGLEALPKNTSFIQDILPKGASSALSKFEQNHPILGGIANMTIEGAADPTTYIGGNTINKLLAPKSEAGFLKATKDLQLPKVRTEPTIEGKQAWQDIQGAYGGIRKPIPQERLNLRNQAFAQKLDESAMGRYASGTEIKPRIELNKFNMNDIQGSLRQADNLLADEFSVKPKEISGPFKIRPKSTTGTTDAIEEIQAKLDNMVGDIALSMKQSDKSVKIDSLTKQIREMGGIAPSRNGAFGGEYKESIPRWMKNKNGRPLDEISDQLGMSASDLLMEIGKVKKNVPKDYMSEAYRYAQMDPEYQALNQTLKVLMEEEPAKKGVVENIPSLKPREGTLNVPNIPKQELPQYKLPDLLGAQYPNVARPIGRRFSISPVQSKELAQLESDASSLFGNSSKIGPSPKTPVKSLADTTIDLEIPIGKDGKLDFANVTEKPRPLKSPYKTVSAKIEGPEPSINFNENDLPKLGNQIDENAILPEPQSKIIIGKPKEHISVKDALKKFYTRVVNTQQPIVDVGKVDGSDIGKMASNTRNVSGIVDYNLTKGLVDKNGNKVGKSLQEVVETIPKGKEEDFWEYALQRHNIDRAIESKNVYREYTPEMSEEAVRRADAAYPEWKGIADNITNWIDKFMHTWGVDEGIVNRELYDTLRQTYKNYIPTQRDFSTLEDAIPDGVSRKFVDQRTPIKKLKEGGSDRDIIDPVENIMNLVNRTIRTAKYNEVSRSLLESVRVNPEKMKAFAEVIPVKEGIFSKLDNVVSVLEDGKPTYLQINDKALLDALEGLPKIINNAPALRAVNNAFKGLITQKNPLFAVRNIFRDIPTSYVYGSESNPLKFGKDIIGAGKDILTNSPRLQRYQAVGGGGANFFKAGDVTKSAAELTGRTTTIGKIKDIALKPIKAVETFNNMIETAPRLAEFNRVLDKTGDVTKALHAANEVTVNFARGGDLTKWAEAGVPYLNASVQGLDRFFRGFISPKTALATLVKSGVAITTPTIALYMVNKDNPKYQALDNRTKDTYYLIPKSDGTFLKIPKSRELGVLFSSLFERALRQGEGQGEPFKGFGNTVATNFAPTNPIENNIASPILNVTMSNKDFAGRPIVPQGMIMDKRSPYLQYDDKTTSIAKAIGELSSKFINGGLSPKQIDYLVKSYTGAVGQLGIPLATPGGSPVKALRNQFISDPTFSNQATTDFYDKLDKLSASAVDKNILEKIPSKKVTQEEDMRNSMQGIGTALSRGTKKINQIQAGSSPNKDAEINAIRVQMLGLMAKANSANDPRSMQRVENESKRLFAK